MKKVFLFLTLTLFCVFALTSCNSGESEHDNCPITEPCK